MIFWHKRLIIFIIKFLVIIISIIVVSLFFYYQYYYKKDDLLKYVPPNAVFYLAIRLNEEAIENKFVRNIIEKIEPALLDLKLDYLNYRIGYNSALALIPNQSNNLNFDYLLIFNLNNKPIKIEQKFNFISKYNLKYDLLINKTLEKNILIVSNSSEIINRVKKIAAYKDESLAKKVNILIGLNKINLENNAKLYIDLSALASNINKIEGVTEKIVLPSLVSEGLNELYLGVKFEDNKLIISNTKKNNLIKENFILAQVPSDTVLNFSFYNLATSWEKVSNILKNLDLNTFLIIDKNLAYWQNLYNFNLRSDILPLFREQGQLIITKDNKYILAVKTKNNDFAKLENSLKLFVATQNQSEELKIMPDYSTITQIVRKPDNYNFKIKKVNGTDLKYINDKLEFGYFYKDGNLILANSIESLENLINKAYLVSIDQISNCYSQQSDLILKSDFFPNFRKHFKTVVIKDNLTENKEFWLCLE